MAQEKDEKISLLEAENARLARELADAERRATEARRQEEAAQAHAAATEAKTEEALRALTESEERYRIMGETIPFGVWWCNPKGEAEYVSPSFLELLNLTMEEQAKFGWTQRLVPEDVEPMMRHWMHCTSTGEPWDHEHRIIDRYGKINTVLSRGLPVWDNEGKIKAWVGVNLDITARKQMELQLQQAKEQLEQALTVKDHFLATISHELRTPLTLILGPVRKLQASGNLQDDERNDLKIIERNARTLLKNVNDLLDLSRLDAGRVHADYAHVDLAWLARFVASHFETIAGDRSLTLAVETPEALPAEVDPEKIQRVLFNLLTNAVKFTPNGGTVLLHLRSEDKKAVFLVEDSGSGIPTEMREAVFERFRQVEGGATRRYGGVGLGLAIVKELVELHLGRVAVDESPLGGARFTVEIPLQAPSGVEVKNVEPVTDKESLETLVAELKPVAGAPMDRQEMEASHGPLVLVVEDNAEMNAFVAEALRVRYRVATAFDGREGLEKATRLRPDLIISDIMMPNMSGEDLVREVRNRRELDDVPILLLSARADDEARVKLLSSGAQDYLIKPFVTEELFARATGLVTRKREAEAKLREKYLLLQEAHARLEETDRRKDEFLAMLSHELRNPLAAVIAALQRLQLQASDDAALARASAIAARQAQHMVELLNDLLDVSRVTQGKIKLKKQRVDLASAFEGAVEAAGPNIRERGHKLLTSLPAVSVYVDADPVRLTQIISNLLDNAANYTAPGGELFLSAEPEADHAVIRVRDNGVGIAEDVLPRIFDLFYQVGRSVERKAAGLGVGLTVVRALVEMHGGQVEAHSDGLGQGSEFLVRLPLATSSATEGKGLDQRSEGNGPSSRILLIEDNRDVSEMLATLLRIDGHEVEEAQDIESALDAAGRNPPDAVLVDIDLPGLDGYELARRIRQERSMTDVPLIALLGYEHQEEKQRAIEAGFSQYLLQPVGAEALRRALSNLSEKHPMS